jgi:hypothetical protein
MLSSYLRDDITRDILDFVCRSKFRKREMIRLAVFVLMCPKPSRKKFGPVAKTDVMFGAAPQQFSIKFSG